MSKNQWGHAGNVKFVLSIVLLLMFSISGFAQEEDLFGTTEDDDLLFGEEFDLEGDDFSFDLEEDSESEADPVESDDFFGDFDDEEVAEDAVETEEDEWGLDTSTDYESLITRETDEEDPFTLTETDHPLDFRKYVKGTIFENTGFTLSLYSPQYVGTSLETWYSYLDYSLTTDLPWHLSVYPVEISFQIDISSFSFDNSFPSGGDFSGVSFMPIANLDLYGLEIELGAGTFYPTFGALAGVGYSFQFHSLFASAGYRWNWAYDINPIGEAWWLEPRFTAGVKLW